MIQTTTPPSSPPELPSVISLDAALKANELFRTCPYSSIRNVQCRFHEGVLILNGEVPSFHMKQTAQELVRHVLRVEQIDNRLTVAR
ncbi:BON domain-containing protein [Novipirellula sp. SH528]|uniref:BON domain-containing protein n=1 Tax=Novipirellula sp. SH528 TaxID=3454466 RepID=UPI003F9FF418